jgi:zinc transport system substrate-binding protein
MKDIKHILYIIILLLIIIPMTGCFKRDSLEDIEIMTTVYPVEFVTNYLYGDHSVINSIYPDGTDTNYYTLSEKQLNDYANKDLFIYNVNTSDKDIASKFLDKNKKLLIIDSSSGIDVEYGIEELWLNPSHLLMMSQNIKVGLDEYISSTYLKKEIEDNYEKLKIELSELDAEIKLTQANATYTTLVVTNDSLKFLEKYGFTVLSLESRNTDITEKTISQVKSLIEKGSVKTIFTLSHDELNETTKSIITATKVSTTEIHRLDNITETERDNKENYLTIMNKNIDKIKEAVFKSE